MYSVHVIQDVLKRDKESVSHQRTLHAKEMLQTEYKHNENNVHTKNAMVRTLYCINTAQCPKREWYKAENDTNISGGTQTKRTDLY